MATEVKAGDKVRVVLEGDVDYVASDYFNVGGKLGNSILRRASHVVSVEVLKAPVKVGDVLRPIDHPDLPDGTVLRFGDHDPAPRAVIVKLGNEWFFPDSTGGHTDGGVSWARFTVLYLPE